MSNWYLKYSPGAFSADPTSASSHSNIIHSLSTISVLFHAASTCCLQLTIRLWQIRLLQENTDSRSNRTHCTLIPASANHRTAASWLLQKLQTVPEVRFQKDILFDICITSHYKYVKPALRMRLRWICLKISISYITVTNFLHTNV